MINRLPEPSLHHTTDQQPSQPTDQPKQPTNFKQRSQSDNVSYVFHSDLNRMSTNNINTAAAILIVPLSAITLAPLSPLQGSYLHLSPSAGPRLPYYAPRRTCHPRVGEQFKSTTQKSQIQHRNNRQVTATEKQTNKRLNQPVTYLRPTDRPRLYRSILTSPIQHKKIKMHSSCEGNIYHPTAVPLLINICCVVYMYLW